MEKIKQFIESDRGKDIFVALIVILVSLSSFGLGRLSKSVEKTELKIEYPSPVSVQVISQEASAISANSGTNSKKVPAVSNSVGKSFFASNRGTKYYPVECSAGKNLKQENRIYFYTKADAEGAGYELSSSC
ncbi:MAG: hypothetical protein M3Q34_03865 [bacterium]|nr:hypothetical protein [bacterium]